MSTVTPLVVRMGTFAARAAQSTIFAAVAVVAILTSSSAAPPSANAADDSCPAIEVAFARGTFEAPGVGATGQAFVDALNARLPGKTVDVYGVNSCLVGLRASRRRNYRRRQQDSVDRSWALLPPRPRCSRPQVRWAPASPATNRLPHPRPGLSRRSATELRPLPRKRWRPANGRQ